MTDRFIIHHGDSLAVLRSLPSASVDAIICDPPYGTGQWQRAESGAGSDCRAIHRQEDWDIWDPAWIAEGRRICCGPILLFCPTSVFDDFLPSIMEPWRMLVWIKSDPRPRFAGQPAYGYEPIIAIGGGLRGGGKDWEMDSAPRINRNWDGTGHPHQKPVDVMRWLVRMASDSGQTILDPFAGSGTTGVAALLEGRNFIGCELSEHYAAIARRRCSIAAQQGAEQSIFDTEGA